jgi:hypothetical protein
LRPSLVATTPEVKIPVRSPASSMMARLSDNTFMLVS